MQMVINQLWKLQSGLKQWGYGKHTLKSGKGVIMEQEEYKELQLTIKCIVEELKEIRKEIKKLKEGIK